LFGLAEDEPDFVAEEQCVADVDRLIRGDHLLSAIVERKLVRAFHRPELFAPEDEH
jgi:hypothetical protein